MLPDCGGGVRLRGIHGNKNMFGNITSLKNLFRAWNEFKRGKLKKQDIVQFSPDLEGQIFHLYRDLQNENYHHGLYESFYICDPKRRHIHKPIARDRVLHHAIFRIIEPIFDKTFIFDSFSSRKNKGVHKAHKRFKKFAWWLSRNNTRAVWILKCDIKKFFDSVDHNILLKIISEKVKEEKTIHLLAQIIRSFETRPDKGIPLGNLTSQLFSNIYLNELDQYVKRELRIKHYIRYADDFVLLSANQPELKADIMKISDFLKQKLALSLHPNKISIRKFSQGVDFLGYIIFPYHQILRTKTKNRMLRKIKRLRCELNHGVITEKFFDQSLQSHLGLLKHCRGFGITQKIDNLK